VFLVEVFTRLWDVTAVSGSSLIQHLPVYAPVFLVEVFTRLWDVTAVSGSSLIQQLPVYAPVLGIQCRSVIKRRLNKMM
jgi:hypothetical protein